MADPTAMLPRLQVTPPPPGAVGGNASAAASPGVTTPASLIAQATVPAATSLVSGVGRLDDTARGLFQPAQASMQQAGQAFGQGDYGLGLGNAVRAVAQGTGATALTAGGMVGAPLLGAGHFLGNVISGALGIGGANAAPANMTPAATLQPVPQVGMSGGPTTAAKAAAQATPQPAMTKQDAAAAVSHNLSSGGASVIGSLPAFLVPQIVGALATARNPTHDPISVMTDASNAAFDTEDKKIQASLDAGTKTTAQAAKERAENYVKQQAELKGIELSKQLPTLQPPTQTE